VVGSLLHVIVQAWALRRRGWRYRPSLDVRQPALREVFRLFVPLAAFVALAQSVPLIERVVGSMLPAGQLSLLTYAGKLHQIPGVVLAASVVTVLFPLLARHQRREETSEFLSTLRHGIRRSVFLTAPIAVWLWFLAPVLVAFVLERGAFSPADTTGAAPRGRVAAPLPSGGDPGGVPARPDRGVSRQARHAHAALARRDQHRRLHRRRARPRRMARRGGPAPGVRALAGHGLGPLRGR